LNVEVLGGVSTSDVVEEGAVEREEEVGGGGGCGVN